MFAIRQIFEDPQDFIPIPAELRHRRTEVIFIALDQQPEPTGVQPPSGDRIAAFRGKGKGGAVARLLQDRQSDRERDA
jgi:hypothetical protein